MYILKTTKQGIIDERGHCLERSTNTNFGPNLEMDLVFIVDVRFFCDLIKKIQNIRNFNRSSIGAHKTDSNGKCRVTF